jgi:hypothetical protein
VSLFLLQIVTDKGSHLDIRLPSITSSLTAAGEYKSPARSLRKNTVLSGMFPVSPDSGKVPAVPASNDSDGKAVFVPTAHVADVHCNTVLPHTAAAHKHSISFTFSD